MYLEKIQLGISRIEALKKKALAKSRRAEQGIQDKVCSSKQHDMKEKGVKKG